MRNSYDTAIKINARSSMAELVLEPLRTDIFIKNGKKVLKNDEINAYTTSIVNDIYCGSLRSDCLF